MAFDLTEDSAEMPTTWKMLKKARKFNLYKVQE